MSEKDFFVVAIGASAGGLDAIQQLFDNIPDETGMTFIIVQHLSPNFESLMPELLTKHTGMPIYTSEDNQAIQPNCIYLNQKNKNLYIKKDRLFLIDKSPKRDLNLPIDIFFHSLGEEYKDRSVGIILSGTGSDGSRGIKSIKEAGGILIVQDPESAQFDGMPNSSIATGLIDFVLSPKNIAETLIKIPNHQINLAERKDKSNRSIYFQILDLIHEKTSINFKQYKKNSLLRRLEKQMNINNFNKLYDYYMYLKDNLEEVEALKQDILIGVTGFFRDEEAFHALQEKVIPVLCEKHIKTKIPIRIWIPGCSTGEEVFTIAFLFDDYIKRERLHIDFKIFATDIDEDALKKAGNAVYPLDSVRELSREYIDTYFTEESGEMKVVKRIRDRIVFSRHDLLKDPPFIRIDLISCRNLLIYIESSVQERVLKNFQFSLKKGSYLLLGSSESLGHQSSFFETINSKWKIYKCVTDTKRAPVPSVLEDHIDSVTPGNPQIVTQIQKFEYRPKQHPENAFYKVIGQEFSPAMVFTDVHFNILFVNGDITTRLMINQGVFQGNLLQLVSGEIATIIRSGIRKVEQENAEVIITNVVNRVGKQKYCFDLGFRKVTDFENFNTVYIIHFSKDKRNRPNKRIVIKDSEADEINKQRISELEEELKSSKSQLQYMVEQLETSNEELQSSNEELMASNEELQSTNEELQSVNEELYTVNTELQETNKELSSVNNDINNLLNSTEIGTLFVNVDLRIRKFTPALQKHFNLQIEDVGRSISSFASNFNEGDSKSMIEDCKTVLADLRVKEAQLSDHEGQYFLRRISPFITADKKIEGLVITFVNITQVLEIQNKLEESEKRYKGLLANTEIGVVVHDNKGDILLNNPKASDLLGLSKEQMRGKKALDPCWKFVYEDNSIVSLDDYPVMRVIKTRKMLSNRILGVVRKGNDILWLMVNGFPVFGVDGEIKEVFISFVDVTERKKAEEQSLKEKKFTERIANTSTNGIFIYDIQKKKNIFFNNRCADILGYTLEEINVLSHEELSSLCHPDDLNAVKEHIQRVFSGMGYEPIEFRFKHKEDRWIWCYFIGSPFEIKGKGKVVSVIGSLIDMSDKKAFEDELKDAKQKAEIANIYKNQFLANMSHEIRTPLNSVMGFADLLDEDDITPLTRKKYISIIKDSSSQLLNLVDDIIDVSKIEANELKLDLGSCNLNLLFIKLEATFTEIQKQKHNSQIRLERNVPEEYADLNIQTDPLRLWQVMSNLIGNALKYSQKGVVEFGYKIPDENTILFFVKDEGIGMPQKKLDVIFNRFERLKTEDTVLPDGAGLGLAISKGIIKLFNGHINIESEVGKGTNFMFTIPLIKEQKKPQEIVADISLSNGKKIKKLTLLVADDSPSNIALFKSLFSKLPYDVFYVENGLQALEFYKKNPETDVVLMDIRMPVMGGVDAAKKILKFDPDARVIAQTAHAMHNDSRKYLKMGFVDYISKPIDREKLVQILYRLGKKKSSPY